MPHNLFDIIILLGALQGFIISTLLYFKKERLYANKLLSILLFLISLACLNIFLLNIQVTNGSTFWTIVSLTVPLVIAMPIGPLLYFYVQSLHSANFKLNRSHRVHFYSVGVDLFPHVVGIVFVSGALLQWIERSSYPPWSDFLDGCDTYADIPRWLSAVVYTWLAWKKLKEFHQKEALAWPKQFVIGFAIFELIWLLHLVPYLIPSVSNVLLDSVGWYPVYVPLVIMVYWLGFNGYLKAKPQTNSIKLDDAGAKRAIETLQKAMEQDRLYLSWELSLADVAKHTSLPQKTISAVLNQHMGKSFNEFVNDFRVREVKRKLFEPGNDHLTISGIALECGFNSQATFQRTFKQSTGMSPTEYLAKQSRKSA